jgi:ABC-type antimicrobial peptide transport system permease subunit
MNIKVKAGLEVVGFFVGVLVVSGLTRLGLDYLESVYGTNAVVDGAIFCLLAGAMYFIGGIIYDIRISQLKYKEKLEEMTKK